MKNQALQFLAVGILFMTVSCSKDDLSSVSVNETANTTNARVSLPGVVYVPLNIVLTGTTNAYNYTWSQSADLDQDTVNDFTFKLSIARPLTGDFYQFTTSITAIQTGGGTISDWAPTALSGMPYNWLSRPLAAGTSINSTLITYAATSLPSTYLYSLYFGPRRGGAIIGKGDKLVGMRFVSGGKTYYGWFRVNVTANGRVFTIKDAAFQNVPDAPIAAGAQQ